MKMVQDAIKRLQIKSTSTFSLHCVRAFSNPKLKLVGRELAIPYEPQQGPNLTQVGFTHPTIPSHV